MAKYQFSDPRELIVKIFWEKTGYEPDIIVLNKEFIGAEPPQEKESVIENPDTVKLIVQVVSSNWRDDYYNKLRDYEEMGIGEYWIVDYSALGPRKFIGNPKQPTFFVCNLVDGEYQMIPFTEEVLIVSPTFPEFNLSAEDIFALAFQESFEYANLVQLFMTND